MMDNALLTELNGALLILMRVSAFILICPGFSFTGLPNLVKVVLSAGISIGVYSVVPSVTTIDGVVEFFFIGLKEVLVGFAIGYICQLFFSAVEMAGKLIDFQVGFSMSEVYDPSLGISVSNYGKIFYWISMCIFFFTDLHHAVIKTLVKSFSYLPLDSTDLGSFGTEGIVTLFGMIFELALNLALPLMLTSLIAEVVLGLISRTVPQINVLILGMPLKVLVSLLMTLVVLTPMTESIKDIMPMMVKYMNEFMRSLPG
ncbi:flagellar biosynthetic protein FliR [Desemzia incerta]|uniref:Flagellar biosynthetic protein FliR n=2 Tax=Desemzia incerta TaxID=82801 RepID=A0A1I5UNX6_9LACT|nr:flagellar biosynthetic protein FliR [Desemzia incerta]